MVFRQTYKSFHDSYVSHFPPWSTGIDRNAYSLILPDKDCVTKQLAFPEVLQAEPNPQAPVRSLSFGVPSL